MLAGCGTCVIGAWGLGANGDDLESHAASSAAAMTSMMGRTTNRRFMDYLYGPAV
jgi:hypothetical protein